MPRDRWDENDPEDDARFRRRTGPNRDGHAAIGIISFVAALLSGVAVFALAAVAGFLTASRGDLAEDSPEAVALGLGIIAGLVLALLALLALVLGVVGLFQGGNRLFPTLGATLSGLVLLGTAGLICAGIVAG